MTVDCNRIEILDLLLEHGTDVNERLKEPLTNSRESDAKREEASETPLHRAIKKISLPSMRWLLEHDADTAIKDCLGRAAFDLAAGDEEMEEILRNVK
ncbi:hypothetical protein V8E51_016017 [Hyaloscypha variabilis]|jgi:ankyrin repeat protein